MSRIFAKQVDPSVLFLVGVLTGALIVSILFLYRVYSQASPANLFSPFYKYPSVQMGDGPGVKYDSYSSKLQMGDGPGVQKY